MKKTLASFLALLLSGWCNLALAAIAVEGSASAGGTGATSGSFAVDCGVNSNRFLFVGGYLNSGIANITTLTYNGVNVPIIYDNLDAGGAPVNVAVLVAPASGSNTLAWAIDTVTNLVIGASCLSDVDQSTPYGTLVAAEFVAVSPTVDVTVATDGMAIDWLTYGGSGGGSYTVGAGQTQRLQQDNGNDSLGAAISTEVAVGTVTMSWTESPPACCYNTVVALPLNKAAAAAASDFFARRR